MKRAVGSVEFRVLLNSATVVINRHLHVHTAGRAQIRVMRVENQPQATHAAATHRAEVNQRSHTVEEAATCHAA